MSTLKRSPQLGTPAPKHWSQERLGRAKPLQGGEQREYPGKREINAELAGAWGRVLRRRRIALDLSQDKFAQLCGMDRTYPSLMERGMRCPSVAVVVRVACVCKVPPATLFREMMAEAPGIGETGG